jgi:hypothetical protein
VDAYQRAAEFGYVDASRDRNKGVPALARGVLCLDYEPPKQVALGNWESETLTNLQVCMCQKRPSTEVKETCKHRP